ncbi:MAG: phosphodiester glycosidase family protein [Clostridia bacterium]|nr:phosphodiester glycosidase family protein [Clostridia bacterium]
MTIKIIRCLLAALLIIALLWLVPSEKVIAQEEVPAEEAAPSVQVTAAAEPQAPAGQIVPIPIKKEIMAPINEQYYTSDLSYADPSLKIEITPGRAYDTDYLVARIKIADPSQLRSALHSKNGTDEANADRIAKHVNALLAINGDSFRINKPKDTRKYIIRQGENKFIQTWSGACYFDILMIDDQANFHVLPTPTRQEVDEFVANHTVVNSFCFGPALVIDGQRQPQPADSLRANGVAWTRRAQRLALCQTGELEYMVVVTGGPDNPKCAGVTIEEFIDIIYAEGTPIVAYNMDGGNSAWLVFRGAKQNTFGRAANQGKRPIADIIYFASAWQDAAE